MATKTHLITADGYVSRGLGLKHGDPTVSLRMPMEKKEELKALIDRLVELKRFETGQDFLRYAVFKAMEENQAIVSSPENPTEAIAPTPKKRGRPPKVKV